MKPKTLLIPTLAIMTLLSARADVLELKDGRIMSGAYIGGSAGTIRFQTPQGVQVIETSQALALTFTGGGAAPAPSAPAPAPTPAPGLVTVTPGTTLLVRMVDGASSRDYKGKRFTATLESDLIVNGVLVAHAGSKVYGRVADAQQAGRFVGRSVLDLRLSELSVGGALVPVVTGAYAEAGKGSLGKTAKGAAAGAAIGAIAGDAGKGAAIGATASGLKKGETVTVRPGELLQFTLQQPVTVNLGQ